MKKKDYSGRYYSTNDFVGTNRLKAFANSVFGAGWEAEDDCDQIITLLSHLEVELFYDVSSENGSDWIDVTAISQIQTIGGVTIDVRSPKSAYITIGDWVVYVDDTTNERIINNWTKGGEDDEYPTTSTAVNQQEEEDFDDRREADDQHDSDRMYDHFERDMDEKFS